MRHLGETHVETLAALVDRGVRFVVIGGHAMNFYGVNRVPKDLDIAIDPAHLDAARAALTALCPWLDPDLSIGLVGLDRNLDIWTASCVPFEELLRASEPATVGRVPEPVRVVSLQHLKLLKLDALEKDPRPEGRARHLADLAALKALEDSDRDR